MMARARIVSLPGPPFQAGRHPLNGAGPLGAENRLKEMDRWAEGRTTMPSSGPTPEPYEARPAKRCSAEEFAREHPHRLGGRRGLPPQPEYRVEDQNVAPHGSPIERPLSKT